MKKFRHIPGQATVEFALVLPLILLLIITFIDLGRIVYFHSALNNAVREGARYAIVNQFSDSDQRDNTIQQKVVDFSVALPLNLDDVSIWCNRDTANLSNPCTEFVTVKAQAEIEPIAVFLAWMLGNRNTFNITAESTMQMTPYGAYDE